MHRQLIEVYIFFACSAEMLVNLGIPWVILGHSERRLILNESNEVTPATQTIGHTPIFILLTCQGKIIIHRQQMSLMQSPFPHPVYIQFVGDKVAYALSQGIKVIACVGETLEQRESGSTIEVVAAQTKAIAGTSKFYFLSSDI